MRRLCLDCGAPADGARCSDHPRQPARPAAPRPELQRAPAPPERAGPAPAAVVHCTGTTKAGAECRNGAVTGTDPPRCRLHPAHNSAHPRRIAFLAAYAELGNVSDACEVAGVGRRTHYDWLDADTSYAAAFADARESAADRLERAALIRAVDGIDEPVFHKGEVVGHVRRYSDSLLQFLLKGARPEKYRERFDMGIRPGRDPAVDEALQRLIRNPEALRQASELAGVLDAPSTVREFGEGPG